MRHLVKHLYRPLFLACALSMTAAAHAAVIDHDAVVGFAQQPASNGEQRSALNVRPYLWIQNGCVPFPAVDAYGNVSGGLSPTGSPEGHCSSSVGQVYVRSTWYKGVWAIMYSWYWPKDEPSSGTGHRHDWENAVVWINNPEDSNQTVFAVSVSEHGKYSVKRSPEITFTATHPLIKYWSIWPLDHALFFSDRQGGTQPLIHWSQLTDAARNTLSTYDFGAANVPFNDNNFWNNLDKAWYQ